ncbi:MAG: sn-glycerol-1-phosphate dehydrogenase [Deltaproteobacteria bacterium]|nr:sn-glycerol-1-phosphate dehydrogenase [Deltaproteobacteria bacterium]
MSNEQENNDGYPAVPTNLEKLAGFATRCACGKIHSIDIQKFGIGEGAIGHVGELANSLITVKKAGLVADAITLSVAGHDVQERLQSSGFEVTLCVVPDGEGGRPHATYETVLDVERQLHQTDFIVAVGSGTINDLGKLASYRLGIPYLVVATAPSMNGYTSAIAAIMKDGLKQTVDCHQPVAVIADIDILKRAPAHLVQAGLGDLESKPVSTADFMLSSLLRGTYYCPVPGQVVAEAEARAAACAADLAHGDIHAIRVLTEALLLSGCSMKLAGSSSPASGGEHLISHYWDMTAQNENRVEGFHGAQVGVATIVTATLYEYLRQLSPDSIDIDTLVSTRLSAADERRAVIKRHGVFGELAADEMQQKRLDDDAYRFELEYVKSHWDDIWKSLSMLKSAAEIRAVLQAAQCPVTVEALGLSDAQLKYSFLHAREIRGRFTVLDFAADLGVHGNAAAQVLSDSHCLSGNGKEL